MGRPLAVWVQALQVLQKPLEVLEQVQVVWVGRQVEAFPLEVEVLVVPSDSCSLCETVFGAVFPPLHCF